MIHKILCNLGLHNWGDWILKDLWSRNSGILGRNCKICGVGFREGHDYDSVQAMRGLDCKMFFKFEPQQFRDWFNEKFYDEKDPKWKQ